MQIGCPNDPVWVVVGDGGFQMNMQELATVIQERLPLKIALLNNGYLGMVAPVAGAVLRPALLWHRLVNPDFLKLAEAYDIRGLMVTKREEVGPAIEQAMVYAGPGLIEFVVEQEENVYPMVKRRLRRWTA